MASALPWPRCGCSADVARASAAAGHGGRAGGRAAGQGPHPHRHRLQAPVSEVRECGFECFSKDRHVAHMTSYLVDHLATQRAQQGLALWKLVCVVRSRKVAHESEDCKCCCKATFGHSTLPCMHLSTGGRSGCRRRSSAPRRQARRVRCSGRLPGSAPQKPSRGATSRRACGPTSASGQPCALCGWLCG